MLAYEVFENFLNERKIPMEKVEILDAGRGVYFRFPQKMKNNDHVVTLYVLFYPDRKYVDIEVYDVAHLTDYSKKRDFDSLMSELNSTTRFSKFVYATADMVKVMYSKTYSNEFTREDAEGTFDLLICLLESAEEAYQKFQHILSSWY